jgi:hypothetical protein
MKLTPNFQIEEFLPRPLPDRLTENLMDLAALLERVRVIAGCPVTVHCGWRTAEHNAAVGGSRTSDHLSGSAADFHVAPLGQTWQQATVALFNRLRTGLPLGCYGQLILEDRRDHPTSSALTIHISIPTVRHPGTAADPDRIMASYAPGVYVPWAGDNTGGHA